LHDRVVKRESEVPAAHDSRPSPGNATFGKVIAVGREKVVDSGRTRALDVKVGDCALFGQYSGTEVKVDRQDVIVMRGNNEGSKPGSLSQP
jgi:chaperonin GroES